MKIKLLSGISLCFLTCSFEANALDNWLNREDSGIQIFDEDNDGNLDYAYNANTGEYYYVERRGDDVYIDPTPFLSKPDPATNPSYSEYIGTLASLGTNGVITTLANSVASPKDTTLTTAQSSIQSFRFCTGSQETFHNTNGLNGLKIARSNNSQALKKDEWFRVAEENGPMEISNEEYRVWISPYNSKHTKRASKASPSEITRLNAALIGSEMRSKKGAYTVGLLAGLGKGDLKTKKTRNKSDINMTTLGFYHSKGLWKGGRYDLTGFQNIYKLDNTRDGGSYLARGNNKVTNYTVDLQGSHVHHFDKIWSVRGNVGNTYLNNYATGYTERGGSTNNRYGASRDTSSEGYGGVGVRWNKSGEAWRTRITATYELGHTYYSKGKPRAVQSFSASGGPIVGPSVESTSGTDRTTHYGNLNATFLNSSSGFKYKVGCNCQLQKKSYARGVYASVEYRW